MINAQVILVNITSLSLRGPGEAGPWRSLFTITIHHCKSVKSVVPSPTKKPSRSCCFGRLESPSNCLSQGSFSLSPIIMIAKVITRQPIRPLVCQILITSVLLPILFIANTPVERLSNNCNYHNIRLMSSAGLEKTPVIIKARLWGF
jgi:hypothetical protein